MRKEIAHVYSYVRENEREKDRFDTFMSLLQRWMMIDVCYSFANVPVGPRKIVVCYFNDNTNKKKSTLQCVFTWAYAMGESTFIIIYREIYLLYVWLNKSALCEKISVVWSIISNEKKKTISQEKMGWCDVMKRSRRRDPCHSIIGKECLSFIFNYIDKYLIHPEYRSNE